MTTNDSSVTPSRGRGKGKITPLPLSEDQVADLLYKREILLRMELRARDEAANLRRQIDELNATLRGETPAPRPEPAKVVDGWSLFKGGQQ